MNIGITWKVFAPPATWPSTISGPDPNSSRSRPTSFAACGSLPTLARLSTGSSTRERWTARSATCQSWPKAQLMEDFDELVADRKVRLDAVRAHLGGGGDSRRYLGRYWVNATSGSSGQPGTCPTLMKTSGSRSLPFLRPSSRVPQGAHPA